MHHFLLQQKQQAKRIMKSLHRILGFTLVETVVVLSLISVCMAVALPKFTHFSDMAAVKTVEQVRGTMISASELVHYEALVAGIDKTKEQELFTRHDGTKLNLRYGYPIAAEIPLWLSLEGFLLEDETSANSPVMASSKKFATEMIRVPTPPDNYKIVASSLKPFSPKVLAALKETYGTLLEVNAQSQRGRTSYEVWAPNEFLPRVPATPTKPSGSKTAKRVVLAARSECSFSYIDAAGPGLPPIVSSLSKKCKNKNS